MTNTKKTSLYLPEDLHRALKIHAATVDKTIGQVIEVALMEHLARVDHKSVVPDFNDGAHQVAWNNWFYLENHGGANYYPDDMSILHGRGEKSSVYELYREGFTPGVLNEALDCEVDRADFFPEPDATTPF